TRLATEIARRLASDERRSAVFVDLSHLSDPGLVASTIANALRLSTGGRPVEEALADSLAHEPPLLVLDNFEQLTAAAPLLGRFGNRLELPAAVQDAPERHRTLRAAIDSSYELLDDAERRLFGRLSVFVGGWTLAAAESICGGDGADEVLPVLGSLADKSLV